MSLNRKMRRQLKKENKPIDIRSRIGQQVQYDGHEYLSGGVVNGYDLLIRNWNSDDSTAKTVSSAKLEQSIIDAGIDSLKANLESIKAGKGISELYDTKSDIFYLIGAGASLSEEIDYRSLKFMKATGTVFATNRALKIFAGNEKYLDYAFFVDSKSWLFTEEDWWSRLDRTQVDAICSFSAHPSVTDFRNTHWFGPCAGRIEEHVTFLKENGVSEDDYGTLDNGFVGLYSLLHLCHRINPKAKIVLLGHDFSYYNGNKYFDRPFSWSKEEEKRQATDNQFRVVITPDGDGNYTMTQNYLLVQAKCIYAAIKNMVKNGAEVINGTPGGCLYAPEIKRQLLSNFMKEGACHTAM